MKFNLNKLNNLIEKISARKLVFFLFVFFFAIFANLIFRIILPEEYLVNESTDYPSFYRPVAQNLYEGRGLIGAGGDPAIQYPPGFPILLSWILHISDYFDISEATALAAFTVIAFGIIAGLVSLLSYEVTNTWKPVLAAIIWITYPFGLWLTKQSNSEIPFLIFFFFSVYLFWILIKHGQVWYLSFLLGVSVGISMLIRPIAIGLPFVFILLYLGVANLIQPSAKLKFGGFLITGSLLIVLPWQIWANNSSDQFVVLSSGGVPSIIDGLTYGLDENKDYRVHDSLDPEIVELMLDIQMDADQGKFQDLQDIGDTLYSSIISQPLTMLKLFALKSLRSWYATDSGRFENYIALLQIVYLGFALNGIIAGWNHGGRERQFIIIVLSLTAYFWIMTIFALSILRYMIPVMGLLLITIPFGIWKNKLSHA